MKISVAMACYNGENYIKEQLKSFSSQTLLPDELIITDDCSTDGTERIVNKFAETAPFNVVFHRNEKNLGYCGNFNAALMKTTGDLVFLSDQDDVWFPEKIETMVRLAETNPDMLVLMNDTELTDGDLNSVGLTKLGQIKSAGLSQKTYVMGCCCAVRRELLELCLPIPERFGSHDKWLVEFADGLQAKLVEEAVLQYYRRHESNESQFIANRITKIGKYDVLQEKIKRNLTRKLKGSDKRNIEQAQIFVEGLGTAIEKGGARTKCLANVLDSKQSELSCLKARAAIRSRWVVPRLFFIMKFMIKGGYSKSSGLKSIARDMLG